MELVSACAVIVLFCVLRCCILLLLKLVDLKCHVLRSETLLMSEQDARPRTIIALWKADLEEPKLHQNDCSVMIVDNSPSNFLILIYTHTSYLPESLLAIF